jgi:hypothetical protein
MKLPRTRHDPPALLRGFLLAATTLYPVWFTIHYRAVYDPDIWWHMRAGEWILQNDTVPRTDWLSTAAQGKPWVLYSWVFDASIAALYRAFGLFGPIIVYPVVMSILISAALFTLATELGLGFWHKIILIAAGLVAIAPICSPRPGLCSVLFFAIELVLLLHSRQTVSSGWMYALPLLFLLWANIHVQFVYGLLVLGLFAIEPWVTPIVERIFRVPEGKVPRPVQIAIVFGLSILATLINPYSAELYKVIVGLATQTGQYRYISELQPATFHTFNGVVELCVLMVAWLILVLRRNFRWVPMTLLLLGTVLAFRTVRDVWFGVLAAVVAIGWVTTKLEKPKVSERWPVMATAFLAVMAGTLVIGKAHPLSQSALWKDTADEFPAAAVEYIKQEHLAGPLYNDWNWGGFLTWALPEIPVYVDSRTNLPGDEVLERSIEVWSGAPGWADDPALSNARLVVANPSNGLTQLLRFDSRFQVDYEDGTAVVFVRR